MSSNEKPTYNPFDPIGRYNLEIYLYNNKRIVLGFTVLFIIFLFGMGWFVWYEGKTDPVSDNSTKPLPPPPKYGYGPYGYGLYAPPRELFEDPPDMVY